MPNRILRDWTDSEAVNSLSADAERFFTRLIMKADDFGRYTADPKLLRPYLFPLQLDSTREASLERWIAECVKARLVRLYEVGGKPYVQIEKFGQRVRAEASRYPDPPSPSPRRADGGHVTVTCQPDDGPPRTEAEAKTETETEAEAGDWRPPTPTPDDLVTTWNRNRGTLPEAKGLGKERAELARARLAEVPDLPRWAAVVRRMADSPFCRGEVPGKDGRPPWVASLDWLLKPNTLLWVEEGKYDDRAAPADAAERRRAEKAAAKKAEEKRVLEERLEYIREFDARLAEREVRSA